MICSEAQYRTYTEQSSGFDTVAFGELMRINDPPDRGMYALDG